MTDKVLFITGASSGIGAETARRAAKEGWRVALFARSEDKLGALAAEIGDAALSVPGDVTDLASLKSAISRTVQEFGQIDAVYANAGTGLDTPGVENGDPEEWRGMIDLNVIGVLYTMKAAYAELKKAKGHLVLTGSVAGKVHISGSIYGASKWFVQGLAGNMAQEMREWGGRCTLVAPGMVDTPFFDEPKPDKLKPVDVANAVVYALGQPAHANVQEIVVMPAG
ncbi:short-chain dehydrogenase [Pelagivirga sediminicola]|uniref:Short-chain dehydrogenase n=1 Tax=Pelagivirga sediminicola TaxID=2170575 RepID=A0A2T7G799_9RHOB|nr:SDR family oxidoreductase [Pelagivirga sediminicola]PVA10256.1 short-chain dehydrogenase [Pelagivirga sediminicola]